MQAHIRGVTAGLPRGAPGAGAGGDALVQLLAQAALQARAAAVGLAAALPALPSACCCAGPAALGSSCTGLTSSELLATRCHVPRLPLLGEDGPHDCCTVPDERGVTCLM